MQLRIYIHVAGQFVISMGGVLAGQKVKEEDDLCACVLWHQALSRVDVRSPQASYGLVIEMNSLLSEEDKDKVQEAINVLSNLRGSSRTPQDSPTTSSSGATTSR